ncbi:MAG: nucleotidyltransferase domain-containing protein [Ignavibacteriaceae bacterium]|nr:nucleotidyltransferase domain-containing protein [Ignavibacteriaceae bacterium]
MVSREVISKVKEYLLDISAADLEITKVFIYGSQARGSAGSESDIDVVLVSPLFDSNIEQYLSTIWASDIRMNYRIEPYPIGEKRFMEDESSPLIAAVKEEGFEISSVN